MKSLTFTFGWHCTRLSRWSLLRSWVAFRKSFAECLMAMRSDGSVCYSDFVGSLKEISDGSVYRGRKWPGLEDVVITPNQKEKFLSTGLSGCGTRMLVAARCSVNLVGIRIRIDIVWKPMSYRTIKLDSQRGKGTRLFIAFCEQEWRKATQKWLRSNRRPLSARMYSGILYCITHFYRNINASCMVVVFATGTAPYNLS